MNEHCNSLGFGDAYYEYDAVMPWYMNNKGKYVHSIYANDDSEINCYEFVKQFGGGGHLHAAGFSSDYNVVEDWMENNNTVVIYSKPRN
jgi:nanoRNase/pAp phosphatase (c-di-AMP/oligoRNAs hydrolase)